VFGSTVLSILFLPSESYGAGIFRFCPNPYSGKAVKQSRSLIYTTKLAHICATSGKAVKIQSLNLSDLENKGGIIIESDAVI